MEKQHEYLETGVLGSYETAHLCAQDFGGGKIIRVDREAICNADQEKVEVQRQMLIRGRPFLVRSIFKSDAAKTATDSLIRLIDHDLEK